MVEDCDKENKTTVDFRSTEEWLSYTNDLVPVALEKARDVKAFPGRWKTIISKLEQIPSRLSDLSSHPCFSKNPLCKEQLQSVSKTLNELLDMAGKCSIEKQTGKLRMQSDLDSLSGKLDLNLRDCGLLIKTGVLGECASSGCTLALSGSEGTSPGSSEVRELLARLQIGHLEAKHKALDSLVEAMKEDEKTVLPLFGRSSISALVQLLTATSPRIREKTVTLICTLVESGHICEEFLISENVLPPLIRLVESNSSVAREKSAIALRTLSTSAETARSIVGHGGVGPLTELCRANDPVSQASVACTLKNLSIIADLRETLVEEGTVKIMIEILDAPESSIASKEYASEFLRNLTSSNDEIKRIVIAENAIPSLLSNLEPGPVQEPAIGAIRNLAGSVPIETLGVLPRLVKVLDSGSTGARKSAAITICVVSDSIESKKLVGESGCIPLLIKLLESKSNEVREVSAQALAGLMTVPSNVREVKRAGQSVPSLVNLLDPGPQNTAKKYAVCCLGFLSRSKKCRKLMVSYGAIGYLKKLTEMEIIGSKKLLEKLQKGKLRSIFGKI